MRRTIVLIQAALAVSSSTAVAQAGGRAPATQAISVNPLFVPFGGFVVEYEGAPGSDARPFTLGLSGGYYDPVGDDDDTYASAEAKLRYYPGEQAPRGFSVGLTVGMARTRDDVCCSERRPERRTTSGATTGVVLDYNWLIGRSRRFFIGTGVGAKRLFGDVGDGDLLDIEVLPTARLQVGIGF